MSLLATGVDTWNYFWRSVLSPKKPATPKPVDIRPDLHPHPRTIARKGSQCKSS